MKFAKFTTLFAIASLAIVACGPKNKENITPVDPAPAAQENNAGLMVFDPSGNEALTLSRTNEQGQKEDVDVEELQLFRGGAFLGKGKVRPTKGELPTVYFSGTYIKVGNTYKLTGDVTVEIEVKSNNTISVTVGGSTVTVTGSYKPSTAPTSGIEKALCVSWKLTQVEAAIASPKVEHKWTGAAACDLKGIATYINQHGGNLKVDAFEDYVIKSIDVNADPKTIVVSFEKEGVQPVVGQWSNLNINSGTFKYHLETEISGKLFKGDADGVITFNADYTEVNIALDVTSNELNGKVILTAKRI